MRHQRTLLCRNMTARVALIMAPLLPRIRMGGGGNMGERKIQEKRLAWLVTTILYTIVSFTCVQEKVTDNAVGMSKTFVVLVMAKNRCKYFFCLSSPATVDSNAKPLTIPIMVIIKEMSEVLNIIKHYRPLKCGHNILLHKKQIAYIFILSWELCQITAEDDRAKIYPL